MTDKMAYIPGARIYFILLLIFVVVQCVITIQWPVPYKRYSSRPPSSPYCTWGVVPFCPTGEAANTMPYFGESDVIEIYALKKPVWQFKFGSLLGQYNIMHDAIGVKNVKTGRNYTMEWYELFELMNCTFPHILNNNTTMWCNQGATCIYRGINDRLWKENGTLAKVATLTGGQFNKFAEWVMYDNRTGIYYETWTVEDKPGGKLWFDSFDCASWVIRAFKQLGVVGAKFNQSIHLNYTRIHLYSDEPVYIGSDAVVFNRTGNATQANEVLNFYKLFQVHEPVEDMIKHLVQILYDVLEKRIFYFYYNYEYWRLPMKAPYVKITYNEVPLPGSKHFRLTP